MGLLTNVVLLDYEIDTLRRERDALEQEQQAAILIAAAYLIKEEAKHSKIAALRREVANLQRLCDSSVGAILAPRSRSILS
jgi:FtsZ-binding cell division protein ZapB